MANKISCGGFYVDNETLQIDNDYLVIVECKKAKYSRIKEKFYLIIDTFHNLGDMISYFLTS